MAVLRQLGAVSVESANGNVGSNILLFTVGGSEQTLVGAIWVRNKSGQTVAYELAHVPSAESIGNKHWFFEDSVSPGKSALVQAPKSMASGDKFYVKVTGGTTNYCSVQVDGVVNP